MTTKNKPKKKALSAEEIIFNNFKGIDEFIKAQTQRNIIQDNWNKNLMNEQKKMFNYIVELDGLIKKSIGGKNEKNDSRG